MNSVSLVLLSATVARSALGPNVRIDHEDKPEHGCGPAAITLGPDSGSSQQLYVALEDGSGAFEHYRSDIMFQKSTDSNGAQDRLGQPGSNPCEASIW